MLAQMQQPAQQMLSATVQPALQQGEQSEGFKLAFGVLKLEQTDFAITQEQAKTLLPLWKALNTLSQSDATAPQELDALLKQIRSSLTAEQQTAMESMTFNMSELDAIAQQLGLTLMAGGGNMSAEARATRQAAVASGEFPGAGMGGGMGGGAGGGIPGGEIQMPNQATQEAFRAAAGAAFGSGNSLGISQNLLQLVISFLEKRAQ